MELLVQEPWQYRWSSCPAYAVGVADPLLCCNVWYRKLADDVAQRQRRWRDFLLGDDPDEGWFGKATGPSGTTRTGAGCNMRARGRGDGGAGHASRRRARKGISPNSMRRRKIGKVSPLLLFALRGHSRSTCASCTPSRG
jgi:hypothetical protein